MVRGHLDLFTHKTGFEAVDTLMEGELQKVHGFPLHPDSQEISLLGLGALGAGDSADRPEEEEKGGLMKRFKKLRTGC